MFALAKIAIDCLLASLDAALGEVRRHVRMARYRRRLQQEALMRPLKPVDFDRLLDVSDNLDDQTSDSLSTDQDETAD